MSKSIERVGRLISGRKGILGKRENINGPTVVKFPRFGLSQKPLFIMYFADHTGNYIKVARSRKPDGPFHRLHFFPIAPLLPPIGFERRGHVASPEVIKISGKNYLLTHSPSRFRHPKTQVTYISRLYFGLFTLRIRSTSLPSYARVFKSSENVFAVTNGAKVFAISDQKLNKTQVRMDLTPVLKKVAPDETLRVRHPFVLNYQGRHLMFFTRIGDAPERVMMSEMLVHESGMSIDLKGCVEVLRPELEYEGVLHAKVPSIKGRARVPSNAVRDPFVLFEEGEYFLYYSVEAEFGIASCKVDVDALVREL